MIIYKLFYMILISLSASKCENEAINPIKINCHPIKYKGSDTKIQNKIEWHLPL